MMLSDFLHVGGLIFVAISACVCICMAAKTSLSLDDAALKAFAICFNLGCVLLIGSVLMEALE